MGTNQTKGKVEKGDESIMLPGHPFIRPLLGCGVLNGAVGDSLTQWNSATSMPLPRIRIPKGCAMLLGLLWLVGSVVWGVAEPLVESNRSENNDAWLI